MKKLSALLAVLMFGTIFLTACSSGSSTEDGGAAAGEKQEVIELNAVSFLQKDHALTATIHEWIKKMEEATNGQVKINWRGGPDVIPISEQFSAVTSGAIDIIFNYTGQYQSQAPEVNALPLSQLTPWEERENGLYDKMVQVHDEKLNVRYIGRWLSGSPRLWLTEPIDSVDDLKGMKIRTAPNYIRFFEALGIAPVNIDPAEVYTSLQTGVAEGFVFGGLIGPRNDGWTDSAKYVLDHPFWNQNCTILMNNDKWNQISPENQEAIIAATAEYERYMVDYYNQQDEQERKELENIGVQFITLPEEEAKKFLDTAYQVEWDYLAEQIPDGLEELRKLTEKQ